jgi:hypothetical protein
MWTSLLRVTSRWQLEGSRPLQGRIYRVKLHMSGWRRVPVAMHGILYGGRSMGLRGLTRDKSILIRAHGEVLIQTVYCLLNKISRFTSVVPRTLAHDNPVYRVHMHEMTMGVPVVLPSPPRAHFLRSAKTVCRFRALPRRVLNPSSVSFSAIFCRLIPSRFSRLARAISLASASSFISRPAATLLPTGGVPR